MTNVHAPLGSAIGPIFLSHGSPTLPFEGVPAHHFIKGLAATLPVPRAILVVSAHWEGETATLNAVTVNDTIHDFSGFPTELYELQYPAPGSTRLASHAASLLLDAGLGVKLDTTRGLDHGAWVPLMLAWPEAEIPVVQLSVQTELGPQYHLELGRTLHSLTKEGVLVLASGSFTHDLSSWRNQKGHTEPQWVTEFAQWFNAQLLDRNIESLLEYWERAPFAQRNHPTEEHLLPLFVALGAGGPAAQPSLLHSSTTYGVLRMDAYAFSAE
ncbi:MAG: class III extradiol ring-cleavage dioxygenase [Erythrobacter sp.]